MAGDVHRRRRDRPASRIRSIYGGLDRKRFIIETNGAGVALRRRRPRRLARRAGARAARGSRTGQRRRGARTPPARRRRQRLYRNRRDGTFEDVTDARRAAPHGLGVERLRRRLRQRRLDRSLRDRTSARTCSTATGATAGSRTSRARRACARPATRWGSGCTFIDIDRDGRLDLFVANYLRSISRRRRSQARAPTASGRASPVNCGPKGLPTDTNLLYRNNGDGTFADVSERPASPRHRPLLDDARSPPTSTATAGPTSTSPSDSTAAILYRNNRDGTFTDVAVESGAAYSEHGSAAGRHGRWRVGDYNARRPARSRSRRTSPTTSRRSIATSARVCSRTSRVAAGLAVQNRYVEWGAGIARLRQRRLAGRSST